jgi:hypothetical protein
MAGEKILTEESTEKKVNEDLENENVDEEESEEFSDSNDENKDEKESSDDDEKGKAKDSDDKNDKKKQSKEENRKFAERRREREKQEKDRKAIEEKAYRKAILEIVKINPYTEKEIKTDKDVQVYLNMKKLEEAGLDPVSDYWQLDEVIAKEKEKEGSSKIDPKQDALQFAKDFPDVPLADLNKDTRFLKFAKGKIGIIPLSEVYSDFQEFIEELDSEADKKARSLMAKAKATPGVTTTTEKSDNEYYTIEEIKKMPQAEISKNWDKVLKSLAKVRSQK